MGFPLQGSRAGPEVVSSCKRSKDAMGNQMHSFLLQAIQGLWEAQMDSPFPNGIHGLPTPFPNRFLQLDTPETGFQGCQEGAAEGAEGGSGPGGAREIFRVVGFLSPCKPLQKVPGSLKDTHGPTWLCKGRQNDAGKPLLKVPPMFGGDCYGLNLNHLWFLLLF